MDKRNATHVRETTTKSSTCIPRGLAPAKPPKLPMSLGFPPPPRIQIQALQTHLFHPLVFPRIMALEPPDPKTLTSWTDAFQYQIPAVRRMEKQLRADVAAGRERVRGLVGYVFLFLVLVRPVFVAWWIWCPGGGKISGGRLTWYMWGNLERAIVIY